MIILPRVDGNGGSCNRCGLHRKIYHTNTRIVFSKLFLNKSVKLSRFHDLFNPCMGWLGIIKIIKSYNKLQYKAENWLVTLKFVFQTSRHIAAKKIKESSMPTRVS